MYDISSDVRLAQCNGFAHINDVDLRRARLGLGWVTVCEFESR